MSKRLVASLPTKLAHELAERPDNQRWMIKPLWGEESVGIIGGEPKCYKSFLALDMAVAVASGKPCLREYEPQQRGRVLVFCGEDQLHDVRARIAGIARASGCDIHTLPIYVITAPTLRIDLESDRAALEKTIRELKPKLVVLDPFVRLHRVDENKSGEVAPLLSYLRELQRKYHVAVILVHHARKGGNKLRGGQALRGSSEFHAWGDSNLYLRRIEDDLVLSVEHRSAASIAELILHPQVMGDSVALSVSYSPWVPKAQKEASVKDQVILALTEAERPLTGGMLRKLCRVRNTTLIKALAELVDEKRVSKKGKKFALIPVPVPDDA